MMWMLRYVGKCVSGGVNVLVVEELALIGGVVVGVVVVFLSEGSGPPDRPA